METSQLIWLANLLTRFYMREHWMSFRYFTVSFQHIQNNIQCINLAFSLIDITVQKMKFSIKDFFSKSDQVPIFLRI